MGYQYQHNMSINESYKNIEYEQYLNHILKIGRQNNKNNNNNISSGSVISGYSKPGDYYIIIGKEINVWQRFGLITRAIITPNYLPSCRFIG